jgi:hypothetical protein
MTDDPNRFFTKEENEAVERIREEIIEVFQQEVERLPAEMPLRMAAMLVFQAVAEALGDATHQGFWPVQTAKELRALMNQMTDQVVGRHARRRAALGPSKMMRLKEKKS